MLIRAIDVARTGWRKLSILAATISAPAISADANAVDLNLTSPTFDQWSYPFANNPGGHPYAAIFGGVTSAGFEPDFDNRDGQMVIGYDTVGGGVPAQRGQWGYSVSMARVQITVESNSTFHYDPTPDPYQVWLSPDDPAFVPDADSGHAVELFGTGFRNGLTLSTYNENTPYSPFGAFGKGIRSAFPIAFLNGQCLDASNNVDEMFDPIPLGVGKNATLTPGQLVPANTVFTFDINVNDTAIHRYLRRSLDQGTLLFNVTAIFLAKQQQTGTYPRFYTKENLAVIGGFVSAAQLQMTVDVAGAPTPQGDVDGDGTVGVNDLLAVINAWGPCACCAADLNYDDQVSVSDLLIVINTWGQ